MASHIPFHPMQVFFLLAPIRPPRQTGRAPPSKAPPPSPFGKAMAIVVLWEILGEVVPISL